MESKHSPHTLPSTMPELMFRILVYIVETILSFEANFWRKETLLRYVKLSVTLFLASGITINDPLTAYNYSVSFNIILLNALLSLGLYTIYIAVNSFLGGLRDDEMIHLRRTLKFSFADWISLLHITAQTVSCIHCFIASMWLLTAYILVSVVVFILMNRCHTVSIQMVRDDPDKQRELFGAFLMVGVCVFAFVTWSAYDMFTRESQTGKVFYFHYFLRFFMLLLDLVYTTAWCLSLMNGLKEPGVVGHNDIRKDQRFIYRVIWIVLIASIYMFILFSMLCHGVQCSFYIIVFPRLTMAMTCSCYKHCDLNTLLGYKLSREFMLVGAEAKDIHDDTCIICRDDMIPNGKNEKSRFTDDDSVKLRCGHVFHYGCLMPWVNTKKHCPTCNQSVFKRKAGFDPEAENIHDESTDEEDEEDDFVIMRNEIMQRVEDGEF